MRYSQRSVPYQTAIGNHESNWPGHGDEFNVSTYDSGGECGVPYMTRLGPALSQQQQQQQRVSKVHPSGGEEASVPWYSFEVGSIHFTQSKLFGASMHSFHYH